MSWLSCFYWQLKSAASDSRDSSALSSIPVPRTSLSPARIWNATSRRNPRETGGGQNKGLRSRKWFGTVFAGPRRGKFVCWRFFFPVMIECSRYILRSFMTGTVGPPPAPKYQTVCADALYLHHLHWPHVWRKPGFILVTGLGPAGLRNNVPQDKSTWIIGQGSFANCS